MKANKVASATDKPKKAKPSSEISSGEARRIGRPSSYRSEFCEQLIDHCRKGWSITGWCGKIGVNRSTVTDWTAAHPEFAAAVSMAKAACLAFYEEQAVDVAKNGCTGGRATMIVFALKNMGADEWRDRTEIKHEVDESLAEILDGMKARSNAARY